MKISVVADENLKHVAPDKSKMVLVKKAESFFKANYSFKKASNSDYILVVKFQEEEAQSGVCNYYAMKTEFNKAISLLNLSVEKDFCANERFGKSEGEIYWVVPKTLMLQKSKICLSINNEKIGILNLSENKNTAAVEQACQ